jgi:glycosyltransferase involved in cell wall biosynthesis
MSRICLITPGHLSTNPRLVKEADALNQAGYDVVVIAADFANWARAADREFADRPWRVVDKLEFGPEARLFTHARQTARQRVARVAFGMGMKAETIEFAACHPIGPDLFNIARRTKADLYIAHYTAALPAAAGAAKVNNASYAFDAEDFHLGDLPDLPRYALEKHLIRSIEGRYLPGCSYITAASQGIARAYAETYGIAEPTVVLNVFPRSQAPRAPTACGVASPGPSIYWFSQTIGADRGLECVARAVGRAESSPHLYIRGNDADGCYVDILRRIAVKDGADNRLHFLSPAAPSEMERLAAAYDIGFSGETGHTQNRRISLGNKLFSYLLAGIPILMADVPANVLFATGLKECTQLYPIDDADALARAIDKWLLDDITLKNARVAAWEFGQTRYNWEREKEQFLGQVHNILKKQTLWADRRTKVSSAVR